ncbi:hypothetical protein D3C85_1210580 [compost metagenome]
MIQLIEQYRAVISELARVTKPGGTLLIETLHRKSWQRKLLRLFEKTKKFDQMYGMDELKKVFIEHGFEQIEFLKIYHPFPYVTKGSSEWKAYDRLCTSFAIKGIKKHG